MQARSTQLTNFRVKTPENLIKRMLKVVNITGLDVVFINKQVGAMKRGTQFGELALINNIKRQSTI